MGWTHVARNNTRKGGTFKESLADNDNDNDPVAEDGMRWDEGEREREEEKR